MMHGTMSLKEEIIIIIIITEMSSLSTFI